jgi:tetraacyldisaccharide 4'-kinase
LKPSLEHYARRVMSGKATGPRAAALRALMTAGKVPYSVATGLRNRLFDAGMRKPAKLPRPVVSVGNITTGGTGKTPVVRWLAERLRGAGRSVAVLSRGYGARPGEWGDEQRMLADLLNRPGEQPVVIRSNPNRAEGGREVLRTNPDVSAFLLDDGYQHRKLARDFDLVLINAPEPFGFGHVLPRGMLRESLAGLRRASAFLLTRTDQVADEDLFDTRAVLNRYNPTAPILESVHAITGFHTEAAGAPALRPDALRDTRWFAFCGIGDPESFARQLQDLGGTRAGGRAFADHHAYTHADVRALQAEAADARAEVLITTEKDWVKLAPLPAAHERAVPIWRADVEVRFPRAEDETRLLKLIEAAIDASRASTR